MVVLAVGAVGTALAVPAAATAQTGGAPPFGTTTQFASVGAPGHPDTSIVAPDGSIIVSTNRGETGTVGPSHLLRYSPSGALLRTYVVRGQDIAGDHGTMGLALDSVGRLYVADYSPPRVLRFDLDTGTQSTYATIPDLPVCAGGNLLAPAGCDNGVPSTASASNKPWPDGLAFAPNGELLVADLTQGTVFSIGPGGQHVRVWLQGPELRSPYGVNSLQFDRDGRLVFDVSLSGLPAMTGRGVLYRIPFAAGHASARPTQLYATQPGEFPDGLALGRSGKMYLTTLVTDSIIVLGQDAVERQRITRTPLDQAPFDSPSSATFVPGGDLLVTNVCYFTSLPADFLVLRVHVGDTEIPLHRPDVV